MRRFDFPGVRIFQSGHAIGDTGLAALETDLHMAKPGIGQHRELVLRQQNGGRDKVRIETDISRVPDQLFQILARCRLASGKMNLKHADVREFTQHALPFVRAQFRTAALKLHRVRAIRALQRAAMRHLRQHGKRNAERLRLRLALFQHRQPISRVGMNRRSVGERRAHDFLSCASARNPLSARSFSIAITSVPISPRSAVYLAARPSMI